MCHFYDRQACCFYRLHYNFFLHIKNTGSNVVSAFFHLVYNYRCQRDQNICKDICCYDIIFFISCLILNRFIVNDVSDHHIKSFIHDLVCFFILCNCRNCTWIKVCSQYMFRTKFQGNDTKDTASGSYVKHLCIRCYIFL